MTRMQALMVEDGLPVSLLLTTEQRRALWEVCPPRPMPLFQDRTRVSEDADTAAFRAQVEAERRQKSRAQIDRMKNRFASKAVDHTKMRWDQRRNKFVSDIINPVQVAEPVISCCTTMGSATVGRTTSSNLVTGAIASWEQGVRRNFPPATAQRIINRQVATEDGWHRVKAHNARALAELNGVWDDKYAKLSGGLLVMTISNKLKGLVKKGEQVRWE